MSRWILATSFAVLFGLSALAQEPPARVAAPPPPPPPPPPPGIGIAPAAPVAPGFPTAKIEYEFVAKPSGKDAFKKTLKDKAKEGWEYVGLTPDGDELVFKKVNAGGLFAPLVPLTPTPPAIGPGPAGATAPLPPPPPVKEVSPPK